MQALVKTQSGKGFLEIRDVPRPIPRQGEALLRVKAAGICGTDLHIEEDRFHYVPPVTIGHEFSGEIAELGPGITGYAAGDRVVAEPHRGGCGTCRYCLTGAVEVCRGKRAIGYKTDGSFAEWVLLPVSSLHRIPSSVSFQEAALCEPLAVVAKGLLERTVVHPEDFVVVMGCGPIGLLAGAAAKAAGARAVLITGTDRDAGTRLRAARDMGIDHAVNVQKEDVAQRVAALTNGAGADIVVEASGAEAAVRQGFELLKIDGSICGLGITGRESIAVPWDVAIRKAARLFCSFSSSWTSWELAVSLLGSGKVNVKPLITAEMPMSDWKTAFERLRKQEAIKILLVP